MKEKTRRTLVGAVLIGMLVMNVLPLAGTASDTRGDDKEIVFWPLAESGPWTDPLDDLSHVYVPTGGLVGVEVSGGTAHLKPGQSEGWIASSIITCPVGHRYDLVYLEAELPGESTIEISILNASAEATEIGFANGTVPDFEMVEGTDLSVYNLNPGAYPTLRIQVNMHADGTQVPRLLSWSLHYTGLELWYDDFLGDAKMSSHRGINFTDGSLEVDLTRRGASSGSGYYEPFPPIVVSRYGQTNEDEINILKPNTARTDYLQVESMEGRDSDGMIFDDINRDGHLDLVCANRYYSGASVDSEILWGDGTGSWSRTGATGVTAPAASKISTGDINGDSWPDIVFAVDGLYDENSVVFINQGSGDFNQHSDHEFDMPDANNVDVGDVNGDGLADVAFISLGSFHLYYSSLEGLEEDPDVSYVVGSAFDIRIGDLDQDGFGDVIVGCTGVGDEAFSMFFGSEDGINNVPDLNLSYYNGYVDACDFGDINGDGYNDIVITTAKNGDYKIFIFPGSPTGWDEDERHSIDVNNWPYGCKVVDLDKDGYDDIAFSESHAFRVFRGGLTFPTTASHTRNGLYYPVDLAVAVPREGSGQAVFRGNFVTTDISLPQSKKWDVAALDVDLPEGTTVKMSVLNSANKPLQGYIDLEATSLDLSGISEGTVRVKVALESKVNETTPVLERLTVKWMDKNVWREEFYGTAKIQRTMAFQVSTGALTPIDGIGSGPQILFPSLRDDQSFTVPSIAYIETGLLTYSDLVPVTFNTRGASATDVADVNGDGYNDLVFAVHQLTDTVYYAKSPLYMGSPVGWRAGPDYEFATCGASDVILRDLNGDGYTDVVFAQKQKDPDDYFVDSLLYWGSSTGWNSSADVMFSTYGATGVAMSDLDGDGRLDLAFSCFKGFSTATDSMVFLQEAAGFCGTVPSHLLGTRGAEAVAAGDLNGDGHNDLVFANSFHSGFAEVNSYIYWGDASGGFGATPSKLPTVGASDVEVADLDRDGDLDVVFANAVDNTQNVRVDSYVYLNTDGAFASAPDARLPTVGASAVAVADLDGVGFKDLVFACHRNGTGYELPSYAYLGGSSGWSTIPDLQLPTKGASDVFVGRLIQPATAGYMSRPIYVDPLLVGDFDELRYTAYVGSSMVKASLRIVDAGTWEVLAETPIMPGTNTWNVTGSFWVRDHSSVRVMVVAEGVTSSAHLSIDDLWLNWTPRVHNAPEVKGLELGANSIYRTQTASLNLFVRDEFDPVSVLRVSIEHALVGSDDWESGLIPPVSFSDGEWRTQVKTRVDTQTGTYRFRASVKDSDGEDSGWVEFPETLDILNNLPSAPEVRITPARPVSTSTLSVEIIKQSKDIESHGLTYHFTWFRNGVLIENVTIDILSYTYTTRGDNWTVLVRAFDGEDEGPVATAWKVIQNAAPVVKKPLVDPEFEEDTADSDWIDLSSAFEDPDGDDLEWYLAEQPVHIAVTIDPVTGRVTLVPEDDWNGEEALTFVASDGELQVSETVTVMVLPVNDAPRIITVNGEPVGDGPLVFDIPQGQLLIITPVVVDVEGHELVFDVNTTAVTVDSVTGEIRFEPDNDAVGTLRFALKVFDVESPTVKVILDIVINVANENDPMDDPLITNPDDGAKFGANKTFYLTVICEDPDTQYGQVLNFTWTSSISGFLGHGNGLELSLATPGNHVITLTVTDGEFQKTALIEVVIEPEDNGGPGPGPGPDPDNNDSDDGGFMSIVLIIVLVLVAAIGGAGYMVMTKRREDAEDVKVDAEVVPEQMGEREALQRMAEMAKEAADALEGTKNGNGSEAKGWVETDEKDGIVVDSTSVPDTRLSMQAQVTKEASQDIQSLWADIETNGNGSGSVSTDEDMEQLRLDDLKRKYQNAIGRLPYGIPAPELREREWTELAATLATGKRKMVEGGKEVTLIDGRWYYSDMEDTGTFLKEHGARPKEARKVSTSDRTALLEKLEERFILGEIGEETYKQLKAKYEN